MRWPALGFGLALLALSVFSFTRVADTQEGQVAEVITFFAFGLGFVLLLYGLAARPRPAAPLAAGRSEPPAAARSAPRGSPRDLALGVTGVVVGAVLVAGLAVTGGSMWAGLGFLILLPMLAGSVYLCWRAIKTHP